ncbi:MAG: hypothetical protein KDA80_01195 [Planctomycetaceae bacterium]|nr:hypothetical protein [Planctomycetaceae bacterium]
MMSIRKKLLMLGVFAIIWGTQHEPIAAAQPQVAKVEFVVGDYLKSEQGSARPEDFPFHRPFGLDFDTSGRMYIVELEGGRVFSLSPGQAPQHISGDGSKSYWGDGGPWKQATYNGMHNIAISRAGKAYIADTWNHCVREVDLSSGMISTVAGTGKPGFSGDGGPAKQAQFDYVMCVSLDPEETALFIADLKNKRIRTVKLETGVVETIAGNGQQGVPKGGQKAMAAPLVDPRAVAVDHDGRVYILERGGHALRRIESDGTLKTVVGTGKPGFKDGSARQAEIKAPKHLCVDQQNRVYIADEANGAIRCYDPETETVSTILGRGHGDPRVTLDQPHGVCIERGDLYVVDSSHNRLFRVIFKETE